MAKDTEKEMDGIKRLRVKITFTEKVLGTSPADPELHARFVASNAPDALTREEEIAAIGAQEYELKQMTIFPKKEDGTPFFYAYQPKGFFKSACSALRVCKKYKGAKHSVALKNYKKAIDLRVFVEPREIIIHMPENVEIGDLQRPLRAQTPQGERVALAHSESIPEGAWIEFDILLIDEDLEPAVFEWLNYGRFNGIGQWRNSGKGTFKYEIVESDRVAM